MTTRTLPRPAALALALFCGACSNSPELADLSLYTIELTPVAFTSAPQVASLGARAGRLSVERAVFGVNSLELVPCTSGAATIGLDPKKYELISEFPAREFIDTAIVDFCELRVAPTSFVAEGVRKDGAPYTLELEFGSKREVTLASDESAPFGATPTFLGVDLAAFFGAPELEETSLEDAELDEDGALVIDSEHSPELADALAGQLPAALSLYADANEDGSFDEDERTPIAEAE